MIAATALVRDEGTIVVFEGEDEESGEIVTFACEHRPAQDIAWAIETGEMPLCDVPSWAILSRTSA